MPSPRLLHRVAPLAVHAARVAVVAGIAWFVHAEHRRFVSREASADLAALDIAVVQKHLPAVATIGGAAERIAGGRDLLDAAGERVGAILKTSPAGDAAIGFSGPTDVLVICTPDLRVAGMEILSSRDTRDHVRAVVRDGAFWDSFRGKPLAELAAGRPRAASAVAGATLTSMAIREALARRLGGSDTAAGRFAKRPELADVRLLFPDAVRIVADPGDSSVIRVLAARGIPLGWTLETSPAADGVIGYQGPTDAIVGFDTEGKVLGVAVLESFDNEPYVGYVRDDTAFRGVYRGMTFDEICGIDPDATGVEGVSGATMTSQAVAEGIVRAARDRADRTRPPASGGLLDRLSQIDGPQWGGLAVIVAGMVTAFTRLRGGWFGRLVMPLVVLGYLGFGAGAAVSQAQLWGWAQAGVPAGATVLVALTVAALTAPIFTRRNVYCSHLCPHGAAQQLLVRWVRPTRAFPTWLRPVLGLLPIALLAVAIVAGLLHLPVALVDLEPFDAYLPAVAGTAAIVIFAASLLASAFVPMAYCRHGCPTGALLDHLRVHRRSDRITWPDGVLIACLALAAAVHWWPR